MSDYQRPILTKKERQDWNQAIELMKPKVFDQQKYQAKQRKMVKRIKRENAKARKKANP